jgi:ClpP class serine protease
METIYALFLQRVSSGRGLPVEAFANAVEGRVFGGVRAKELHLVDELGGLQAAIDDARSLAGLSDTTPVVADEPSGLLGQLSLDDEARAVGVRAFGLDFQGPREIAAMQRWLLAFVAVSEGEGYATMLPSALVVR